MLRVLTLAASFFVFGSAAFSAPPRVAADILPVHSLVAQVMDGIGKPKLVVPPGASPHNHALRPSEARALQSAQIIFWAGETLSPWLGDPLGTLAQDALKVDLLNVDGTRLIDLRQAEEGEEAGDAHDHGHGAAAHGHDPHAWLDPRNAVVWLQAIADELARVDPENSERYLANALSGQEKVKEGMSLIPIKNSPRFAVYHDAYQYFESSVGLDAPVIISASDASAPGAAHLREVRQGLLDQPVSCLLVEPGYSKAMVTRLIEGTDIQVMELDPLGSSFAKGPSLYLKILDQMATSFEACSLVERADK